MIAVVFFVAVVVCLSSLSHARLTSLHGDESKMVEDLKVRKQRNLEDKFCSTPISKGKVNFPDNIAGRAQINFDMYSGYVNVTSAPDYLFYWFHTTKDNNPDAPLIVW